MRTFSMDAEFYQTPWLLRLILFRCSERFLAAAEKETEKSFSQYQIRVTKRLLPRMVVSNILQSDIPTIFRMTRYLDVI